MNHMGMDVKWRKLPSNYSKEVEYNLDIGKFQGTVKTHPDYKHEHPKTPVRWFVEINISIGHSIRRDGWAPSISKAKEKVEELLLERIKGSLQ